MPGLPYRTAFGERHNQIGNVLICAPCPWSRDLCPRPFPAPILCVHSLRPHGGRESGGAKRRPCTSRLEVGGAWLGRARFPPKKRRRASAGVHGRVLVVSRRPVKVQHKRTGSVGGGLVRWSDARCNTL